MRFVAGRGTVAERLQRGGAVAELLAGALRRRAIRKMLLAGAQQWQRYCWPGFCGERLHCGRDADAREIHREEGKQHARRKSNI